MYSIALVVCYLLTSTPSIKIVKSEDNDDLTESPVFVTIMGIILGFLLAVIINDPSLLPSFSFGQWLVVTVITLGIAVISMVGIYILLLAGVILISIITNKIGILSIIGSCFLFLSLKNNLILFIIFIIISLIGLTLGYFLKEKTTCKN
jgi:hypothetical protein